MRHKRVGPPREDPNKESKCCTKCGLEKPVSEFDKRNAKYADGTSAILPISSCRVCRNEQFRDAENARTKAKHRRDREAALRHYSSGGPIICRCCGESQIEMLSLDHISNDGAQHRKSEPAARSLPTYLRSRDFPPGYQVLCLNCNIAKHHYGECPHQINKRWPGAIVKPGAIVDKSAKIGPGTIVWPYASVGEDVVIGRDCVIGACAYIGRGTKIGDGTRLQTGVFLPNYSILEESVFVGPHVICTDDKYPRSGNKDYHAQPPRLCAGCSIGANATILPGVKIGAGAMIGAGAIVTKDVLPDNISVGLPARAHVRLAVNN